MAVSSYHSDRAAKSPTKPLPGLGDEAFMSSTGEEVMVAARRANVTVSIRVDLDPQRPHNAEESARALITAILADIRLDDRTTS